MAGGLLVFAAHAGAAGSELQTEVTLLAAKAVILLASNYFQNPSFESSWTHWKKEIAGLENQGDIRTRNACCRVMMLRAGMITCPPPDGSPNAKKADGETSAEENGGGRPVDDSEEEVEERATSPGNCASGGDDGDKDPNENPGPFVEDDDDDIEDGIECDLCSKKLARGEALKTPCCGKVACSACAKKFKAAFGACFCERQIRLMYVCGLCDQNFLINDVADVYRHINSEHLASIRHHRILYLCGHCFGTHTHYAPASQIRQAVESLVFVSCPHPDCASHPPVSFNNFAAHYSTHPQQATCPVEGCTEAPEVEHLVTHQICLFMSTDGQQPQALRSSIHGIVSHVQQVPQCCQHCIDTIPLPTDEAAAAHAMEYHVQLACPCCSATFPCFAGEAADQHLQEQHPLFVPYLTESLHCQATSSPEPASKEEGCESENEDVELPPQAPPPEGAQISADQLQQALGAAIQFVAGLAQPEEEVAPVQEVQQLSALILPQGQVQGQAQAPVPAPLPVEGVMFCPFCGLPVVGGEDELSIHVTFECRKIEGQEDP